eukprot:612825-Pelagomonas_calceolata.AAC.1
MASCSSCTSSWASQRPPWPVTVGGLALETREKWPPPWTTTHNTNTTGAVTPETPSLVPIITPSHPDIPVFLSASGQGLPDSRVVGPMVEANLL